MRRTMESVAAERLNKIGKNPSLVSNRAELEDDINTVNEIIMQTTPLASSGSDVSLIDMSGTVDIDEVITAEEAMQHEEFNNGDIINRGSPCSTPGPSRASSHHSLYSRHSSHSSVHGAGGGARYGSHHRSRHGSHHSSRSGSTHGSHQGSHPNSLHGSTGSEHVINMKKSRSDSFVGLARNQDDRESLV